MDGEVPIRDGSNSATSTSLTDKVTTTPRGAEAAEEQRQVKGDTTLDTLDDIDRTGRSITKPEIITRQPNIKLTNMDGIDKKERNSAELVLRNTKKHMATHKGRSQGSGPKKQRLEPRKNTRSQRTVKEKMV